MNLLLVAADPMEFQGFSKRQGEVAINGHTALLTTNGAGWDRAAAAVDRALDGFHADAVVSTCFSGALDPALDIAGIVVATHANDVAAFTVASDRPFVPTGVASIDHIAGTASEKAKLRAS